MVLLNLLGLVLKQSGHVEVGGLLLIFRPLIHSRDDLPFPPKVLFAFFR